MVLIFPLDIKAIFLRSASAFAITYSIRKTVQVPYDEKN